MTTGMFIGKTIERVSMVRRKILPDWGWNEEYFIYNYAQSYGDYRCVKSPDRIRERKCLSKNLLGDGRTLVEESVGGSVEDDSCEWEILVNFS